MWKKGNFKKCKNFKLKQMLKNGKIVKKKIIIAAMVLCFCVGLFACFNPLRKLPKVTEENIFNEENGTTGNTVADEIIDSLMDAEQGVFEGEIKEFWIYNREDSGIKTSSLCVGFIAISDQCEYTGYYIVDLDYNMEDGWEISEVRPDNDKERHFRPLAGATVAEGDIRRVPSFYYRGYVVVPYFDVNLENVEIISDEITEEAGEYFNTIVVRYDYTEYGFTYTIEAALLYKYYYDFIAENNYWYLVRCEEAQIVQVVEE